MLTLRIPWTNQTLDKHVSDSTDSDNEEKEDGELEEGEVEEEFEEMPPPKDDAKENNRENTSTNETSNEPDNAIDTNNHHHMGPQKYRRREYHHHLGPPRMNSSGGQQDKRNKHDQRRKRRHSGEERDERNRKPYKRGRFRGGPMPDMLDDGEEDEAMDSRWSSRGPNRGQRKQQSDILLNDNSESVESGDQPSSLNPVIESKSEQSINSDETSSPVNDHHDDENMATDDKQDRSIRPRMTRSNHQQNSMSIENRGRRYYDGNANNNNNNMSNNRRLNDRDRSSWQDRNSNNNSGNNPNSNNQRFRSDTGSSNNHGPPLCKFYVENRCMKGNDCLFSHDYKPQKKMEVCKYYVQNKGYCQKNDSCPYLHGEFPCKFFHTGQKICMQADRCKFSHDAINNDDIRCAFERFLVDTDEMNRQNRGNPNNSNIHHNSNTPSVNFDVMSAPPLPLPPPLPGSLGDPSNFPMIPNLMDLFLLQNSRLSASVANELANTDTTATNPSQTSPPMQRPSLFTDTLSTEKTDNEESSTNKSVSATNSTSPSSSTQATASSTNDSTTTGTVTTTSATPAAATTSNSTCPLPLPPSNTNVNLPSPFGRLPPPGLARPTNSLLPPPPPGLFSLNSLGTGRVPILFPTSNGLPMPPPPGSLIDMKLLAQAAALAAANAAIANQLASKPHHHQSQSSSPQLGRDIDERDRQSSTGMRGDIDERPSDVYSRPAPNLGLLQTASPPTITTATKAPVATANLSSPNTASSPPTMTINDEHLKSKASHDIFRTTRPTSVDTLSSSTSANPTVGPSFDFISMLEQLKQPRQVQTSDNSHDSLEIRTSSSQAVVYTLRPVLLSFKPYALPDESIDPRTQKYRERMSQWSEQARLERFKTPMPSMHNYSVPLRTPQHPPLLASSNDSMSSRDPRLLRNSTPSSKLGMPMLPASAPFARPNDNIL